MTTPFRRLTYSTLALLALAAASPTPAAGLRISPIRMDFSKAQPTSQVELSNLTAVPVPVQVKAFTWRQVDGEDVYEPTKDLFFAPPIVTVPANGRAAVRFRLRAGVPDKSESSYRVYFQELPSPSDPANAGAGMTYRIRFGVPAFVLPPVAVAVGLNVAVTPTDAALAVVMENTGTAHLRIDGVDLFPDTVDREKPASEPVASVTQSNKGTNYILPGSRVAWTLALPAGVTGGWLMRVRTDDHSGRAGTGILKNGWYWKPVSATGSDVPANR